MRRSRAWAARLVGHGLLALVLVAGLAACGTAPARPPVRVAYAGSLVTLMERQVGPAFTRASGFAYQGRGAGSVALANQLRGKLLVADVFISASPAAMALLEGPANGNLVRWSITFGATAMVLGYNPNGPHASAFRAAAAGQVPWYEVLRTPGLRLGRTDPALDPKGWNTLFTMQLAERFYRQPGLAQAVLGPDENPAQVFPEEELVARLSAGQLDAGFFYTNEARQANIPYLTLPPEVNLGDPTLSATYAQVHYTSPQGTVRTGAPVTYSLTIPASAPNPSGAEAFARFLLGAEGMRLLTAAGISPTPLTLRGDRSALPSSLAPLVP